MDNYNLIVEQILEISPAYNADKEKGRKRHKADVVEEDIEKREYVPQIPILPQEDSPPEYETLRFHKKKTSYVSNVDGLDSVTYLNRST